MPRKVISYGSLQSEEKTERFFLLKKVNIMTEKRKIYHEKELLNSD